MDNLNIMIVGVGGQGSLLASKMIGTVALNNNYDVKVSEVHGMAQRGGSVVTYVKLGSKISSPIIEEGQADVIISFERLEALRWEGFLKAGGRFIVNDQRIEPMPVITGRAEYPTGAFEGFLKRHGENLVLVDALEIAGKLGNTRVVNMVLIGILASTTKMGKEEWLRALEVSVPPRFKDINVKAFEIGFNIIGG